MCVFWATVYWFLLRPLEGENTLLFPDWNMLLYFKFSKSLVFDLRWPASIPEDTVSSWWRRYLSSVIVLCAAGRHGMGVNTSFKLLRLFWSSCQTEVYLTFLSSYSQKGSHFISLAQTAKSLFKYRKKLVHFFLSCLCGGGKEYFFLSNNSSER